MDTELDITKKYRTRDGRNVHSLQRINNPIWPLVGVIINEDGTEKGAAWHADGRSNTLSWEDNDEDLILVPPTPRTGFARIPVDTIYHTLAEARQSWAGFLDGDAVIVEVKEVLE